MATGDLLTEPPFPSWREHRRLRSVSMQVRRGDLFWIVSEQSPNGEPGIAHPHAVIQDDVFNRSRLETVIVCALTSNLHRADEPGNVLLDHGEGNLPKRSVLVVSQISSVARSQLGQYIGSLAKERIDQVLDGLRFQQASFFRDR